MTYLSRPGAVLAAALLAAPCAAQLPSPATSAPGPVSVGGYVAATVRYVPGDALDADPELHEAAAALLVSGTPWPRLSYFAEVEAASVSRETYTGREEERWLEVERAYVELTASDAARLRVGRFLTPIGQWNEVHAAPLTWTAARPLTTYRPFAKSTTGVLLAGELALGPRDAGYAVWVAPFGGDPEGEGEESAFVRGAGGRMAVEALPGLYLGVSGAAFRASRRLGDPEPDDDGDDDGRLLLPALSSRAAPGASRQASEDPEDPDEDDDREEDVQARALVGADLSWRIGRLHLLSELTWLGAADDRPAERGGFVQGALPLARGLYLTGRAERYDPVVTGPLGIYTAGLAWRPAAGVSLKVERQATDRPSRRVADGWLASLSALF